MIARTHTRIRPSSAPPYYQGRPAAFWLKVWAPRPRKRAGCQAHREGLQAVDEAAGAPA